MLPVPPRERGPFVGGEDLADDGLMTANSYIERYAYFGSFRSSQSNVGPDGAMLTTSGQLTDIGSWYLGGSATGNIPSSAHTISPPSFTSFGLVVMAAAAVVVPGIAIGWWGA